MAPAGTRYTLVGFSALLDWRPLHFVESIPPGVICSACGLVRRVTARFRCQHVLCEVCYEYSALDDVRICPLDGHRCLDEHVDWEEIAADALLDRQVRCWNEHGGCDVVTTPRELSEHFLKCRYHSTSCPKCSEPVLCTDVYAHLIADCRASLPSASPLVQRGSGRSSEPVALADCIHFLNERTPDIYALLEEILKHDAFHNNTLCELESRIVALKERVEDVSETSRCRHQSFGRSAAEVAGGVDKYASEPLSQQSEVLTGASESIKKLKKTLRDELELVAGEIRCDVAKNAAKIVAMHSEFSEASQEAFCRLERLTAQTSLDRATYRFAVERIGDLVNKASKGSAKYLNDPVYLRGYCMSPGLGLKRNGDTVSLHGWIVLHKGEQDESLQWPVRMAVKLCVIHPVTGVERADSSFRALSDIISLSMEQQDEPKFTRVPPSFFMSELQQGGFVNDDRLVLKYELISRRRLN